MTNEKKLVLQSLRKQLKPKLQKKYGKNWKKEFSKQMAGKPLYGPNGLRRKACKKDLELFGKLYLPEFFSKSTPEFHREINEMWKSRVLKRIEGTKTALAAPRGHAKSTNVTLKNTLHAILYEYKRYILIISDSSDQANTFLIDIKDTLEFNSKITQDFGNLKGKKYWKTSGILTSTGVKVEALGSGKKIRGRRHKQYRPDLIILDDIENDENVRTPEQRKKLMNWYYKAVSKAGAEYTDFFYIGTILHYDSLLSKVLKNPAYMVKKYKAVITFAKNTRLWASWESIFTDLKNEDRERDALEFFHNHETEMMEGVEVLWPEKKSYYSLMVDKISEGTASFNSEYQNEPIDPDDCYFSEEKMRTYNEYELFTDLKEHNENYLIFGFVDPSLGKNKTSDYSAIITVAKEMISNFMYVIDADIERRLPNEIISAIFAKVEWLRLEFGLTYKIFGVETNQFQLLFKDRLAEISAQKGVYLPLRGINQNADKIGRIQSMQPDVENGYIKFNIRHKTLDEQMRFFPMASHDDGPDALQGALNIAKNFSSSICVGDMNG